MVRNVLPTSNVQGKKKELDRKNNELLLDYKLENKNNLYLNHMPPAAEALGKMVILGVVQWQDQSGQCLIPRLFVSACERETIKSTSPGSRSLITCDPKCKGRCVKRYIFFFKLAKGL